LQRKLQVLDKGITMSPAFGNPTGTFAQMSQTMDQPSNGFGGLASKPANVQGGFGGQQQGGFADLIAQQQGGGYMPQMQSPYGPQQGGFGGGFGGGFQSPYGPQMGGFGGYGQQMGGFGGYGQQMGGFGGGMMGGGFNPYQQGMMGGFGGGFGGGMGGGFNPYQMQSPYGPQMGGMGGYGGGFGGGMGGFGGRGGYGRGRGMGGYRGGFDDRMVGNQGMGGGEMASDMRYKGNDMDMYTHALPSNYRPSAIPNTQLGRMNMSDVLQNQMMPQQQQYIAY
jgi:hypothetical protein